MITNKQWNVSVSFLSSTAWPLFFFKENIFKVCVFATVWKNKPPLFEGSWHLWSLSLGPFSHWTPPTTHSNSFILVSNIIDCCQSSHPHLSIFLNATNVQSSKKKSKIKKNLKRNGGGIDYSLPDFCMISPAPLKQQKSEQITPSANERGKWMEYLSRLKRKPVLRFNLCL